MDIEMQYKHLQFMLFHACESYYSHKETGDEQATKNADIEATQIEWLLDNMTAENPWLLNEKEEDMPF